MHHINIQGLTRDGASLEHLQETRSFQHLQIINIIGVQGLCCRKNKKKKILFMEAKKDLNNSNRHTAPSFIYSCIVCVSIVCTYRLGVFIYAVIFAKMYLSMCNLCVYLCIHTRIYLFTDLINMNEAQCRCCTRFSVRSSSNSLSSSLCVSGEMSSSPYRFLISF